MQQAVIHAFGNPPDIRVEALTLPEPAADEVRVRMAYAPINPADLNVMEGRYPKLPTLPGVPGNEGVGIVEAAGAQADLAPGAIVIAPGTLGAWASHRNLRCSQLVELPADVNLQQAAMLTVNPATAWRVLKDFVELQSGDWVVTNAANSGVGRWLIHLAQQRGIRVGAVVRREELIPELEALGAAAVVAESANPDGLRAAMGGGKARLALNMVGGASAAGLLCCLANGATHVTIGAMGREAVTVGNGALIFKDLRIRGYWHTAVIEAQWNNGDGPDAPQLRQAYQSFATNLHANLEIPIEKIYPLNQIQDALNHAASPTPHNKILLEL